MSFIMKLIIIHTHHLEPESEEEKGVINFWKSKKYIQAKVKKSESLMIWASISSKGPGLIYFLQKNKKFNSHEYINILKKKLQKSMNSTDTNIFLHDKTSKLTSNYLHRKKYQQYYSPWVLT